MLIRELKKKEVIMEIKINAVHFETSQRLEAFILKKVGRLEKYHESVSSADVTLKVVKPETNENKDASVKLFIRGHDFFAQEVANTFEAAIDSCVDKLERQVVKFKEKQSLPK
jgi:putative sigma-54 modulation protein